MKGRWTAAAIASWVIALGVGEAALWRHSTTPGDSASPRTDWPEGATVPINREKPTLILFAHPRCPCTKATLAELDAIAKKVGDRVVIQIRFFRPHGVPTSWAKGSAWTKAETIARASVSEDDGSEARRFGARTSGHVVIYGPDGRLRFRGGIVGSRGLAGDNPSRREALAAIDQAGSPVTETPVYGCPLFDDPNANDEDDPR